MWITSADICDNVDKEMSIQRDPKRKITPSPDKIVPNDQMIFSKNNLKIVQSRVV